MVGILKLALYGILTFQYRNGRYFEIGLIRYTYFFNTEMVGILKLAWYLFSNTEMYILILAR